MLNDAMALRYGVSALVIVLLAGGTFGEERARAHEEPTGARVSTVEHTAPRLEGLTALAPEAVLGLALGDQSRASLAGDAEGIVAVWQDARGILASRISPDGELLDPVAPILGKGIEPKVAWNGERLLVVWVAPPYEKRRVEGVLLDRELRVIKQITAAMSDPQDHPYVSNLNVESNGRDFLVAWSEYRDRTPPTIYVNVVSTDGQVLERQALATASPSELDVTNDGSDYYLAWTTFAARKIEVAKARGSDGSRLWSKVVRTAFEYTTGVAIAWTGAALDLVWIEGDVYGTKGRLLTARTAPEFDGSVTQAPAVTLVGTPDARQPEIVSNEAGTELVIWSSNAGGRESIDLWATALEGGRPVTPATPLDDAVFSQTEASSIWTGSQFLVTWRDGRHDDDKSRDLRFAFVTPQVLEIETDQPLGMTARSQAAAALAAGSSTFLAVWEESTSDLRRKVVASLLDPSGMPRNTFDVSTSGGDQKSASVSYRAGSYLVAWAEQTASGRWSIRARRFDEAGIAIGGTIFELATMCCRPDSTAITANADRWLVLWSADGGVEDRTLEIYGSLVGDDGFTPLASGGPLSPAGAFVLDWQLGVAAASDGHGFLVTWQEGYAWPYCNITCPPPYFSVRTLPVGADGVVGQSSEVVSGMHVSPAVGWNGSEYLLVWIDQRPYDSDSLTGARIRGGVAEPAFLIERKLEYQFRPRVVASRDGWLVVWETRKPYAESCPDTCQWEVVGKLLPFDGGTPGETARLYPEGVLQAYTAIAVMPGSSPMVVFSRFLEDEPYGALRVFSSRLVDSARRRPVRR